MKRAGWLAAALWLLGCAGGAGGEPAPYRHNRHDYAEFRRHWPSLLEPNYLPFMAARVALPAEPRRRGWRRWLPGGFGGSEAEELLVFCRWPDDAFPLAVYVVSPRIPEREDVLHPRSAEDYVAAAWRALALWERGLEGRVRFTRAVDAGAADFVIELRGEEAPVPDPTLQVLGATPLGEACQVEGGSPQDARLRVRYRVSELRVYVVDRHGLLLPDQVERVALHEIGHVLGMHGHSPIPNDLMYRVVRDRLPRGELGAEDVNSFVSLYAIPNGSVYVRLPPEDAAVRSPADPPPGPPRLALAPHVDARLGYEVQLPEGWTRVSMDQGVVAVDGLTWDYVASFQLLVRSYPSLDAYLDRHAGAHLAGRTLLAQRELRIAGRPALRFVLESFQGESVEELTFVDAGDERVLVAIAESPSHLHAAYEPIFAAIFASLELRGPGPAADREYSSEAGTGPGIAADEVSGSRREGQ